MITSLFADWMRDSNKEMAGGGVTQGQAGELAEGGLMAAVGAAGRKGGGATDHEGAGAKREREKQRMARGAVAGLSS